MHVPTDMAAPSRSVLTVVNRLPFWSQVSRHPRAWAGVLFASASWNLFLGVLTLGYGLWVGLLPLAGSVLAFWIGYRLYQITPSEPAASAAGRTAPARR